MNMELHIPADRLERRIRLLLHAYPPGYRADRGEEMLATLLEATPHGRGWPSARDSWSLLAGGTRARRTANRQAGPVTSLRQAAVLGLALYLSLHAAEFFLTNPLTRPHGTPMLAGFLLAATVLAVWVGHRTVAVTAVAASVAVLAYFWFQAVMITRHTHRPFPWMAYELTWLVPLLLAVLALALLSRRDGPPPRSWLLLACAPLLAVLAARTLPVLLRPDPAPGLAWNLLPEAFLLLAIPALAWLATDARPALGLALAHVVAQAETQATFMQVGIAHHEPTANIWQSYSTGVETLALTIAMTAALAWMLRRRTRPHPR